MHYPVHCLLVLFVWIKFVLMELWLSIFWLNKKDFWSTYATYQDLCQPYAVLLQISHQMDPWLLRCRPHSESFRVCLLIKFLLIPFNVTCIFFTYINISWVPRIEGKHFHHHHHFLWCIVISAVYMALMPLFLSLVHFPPCSVKLNFLRSFFPSSSLRLTTICVRMTCLETVFL